MLILPTKAADASVSRSFQDRNLNSLAMDSALAEVRLVGRNIEQGGVVNRFHEAIAQRVEYGAQGPNVLRVGHVLLYLRTGGAIIHKGPARDCAARDRNRRVHEVSVFIQVTDAKLGNLAGTAGYRILMAFRTRGCVEHRTEAKSGVFPFFK